MSTAPTELNLPLLATELVQAQCNQADTLKEGLAALQATNAKISQVEERNKRVQLDLYGVEKEICALRYSCGQSEARAQKLRTDVASTAEHKCRLQHGIAQLRETQQGLRSELLKSRKKMTAFVGAAHGQEQKKEAFVKLDQAKMSIAQLKAQCRKLSEQLTCAVTKDGERLVGEGQASADVSVIVNRHQYLEAARDRLVQKSDQLVASLQQLREEVDLEKKKVEAGQQSIHMVKKRQAAQLTRLRRQVQDAQQRNRRWRSVAAQYRQQIAVMRRQLS